MLNPLFDGYFCLVLSVLFFNHSHSFPFLVVFEGDKFFCLVTQAQHEVRLNHNPSRPARLNVRPHQLVVQLIPCYACHWQILCSVCYLSCFSLATVAAHLQAALQPCPLITPP